MAPVIRNIALAAVGVAILLGLLLSLTGAEPAPASTKPTGVSGQTIFWLVVLVGVGASFLSSHTKTKPFSRGMWLLVLAIPLWWFVWGAGGSEIARWFGADPTATPIKGAYRVAVNLRGGEVSIGHIIPACTRYTIESGGVRNPRIKFADGSSEPLGMGREFGWRDPVALQGEGVAYIWLFDPGKSCRRS